MLSGGRRRSSASSSTHALGGAAAADLDGPAPAGRGAELHARTSARNSLQPVEVPRRLDDAGQLHASPALPTASPPSRRVQRRHLHPQSGTTQKLDSLADRMMYRLAYRNFGDHESLVVAHAVDRDGTSAGVRWYESEALGRRRRSSSRAPTRPDANYRWMGSVAMDKAGNVASATASRAVR